MDKVGWKGTIIIRREKWVLGCTMYEFESGREAESQMKIIDPSVAITDSSATEYDSADESLVCSTPLPSLEKLASAEPHLKSQGGSSSRSKTLRPSKPFPTFIHCGFNDHLSVDCVNYPNCDICGSYDPDTPSHYRSDIRKPISYLDSGCSRHMTGAKSYIHKYVEHPGPKVVFGDDSTCIIEGYGSIKCN
nr:retrovirus-related Pol polyprotein from transposon TNT 1-94 [Tanacetum cinerariifolium]